MPAPPHGETGHTWHHDNGLLIAYTKLGGQAALEVVAPEVVLEVALEVVVSVVACLRLEP